MQGRAVSEANDQPFARKTPNAAYFQLAFGLFSTNMTIQWLGNFTLGASLASLGCTPSLRSGILLLGSGRAAFS